MGCDNYRDVDSGRYNLLFSVSGTLDVHFIRLLFSEKQQNITKFIENDLQQRLNFIYEPLQYGTISLSLLICGMR